VNRFLAGFDVSFLILKRRWNRNEVLPTSATKYQPHELENNITSPHRDAPPLDDLKRWDEVIDDIQRFAEGMVDFINVVDLERGY
jgi:hypothetical protein